MHLAHQRVELGEGRPDVGQLLDLDLKKPSVLRELADRRPPLPLDQHLDGAVGQAQQLDDGAERPDREDVLGDRLVGLGLAAGAESRISF